MNIKNIKDLEKEIMFILTFKDSYVDFYKHFRIENYSTKYNDLYDLQKSNTKIRSNINLKSKIESLKIQENDFISLTNELNIKFNTKKINSKLNKLLKIITFGIFNWNKKIDKKLEILEKIKEIKQSNIVKINELQFNINKKLIPPYNKTIITYTNENHNFKNNVSVSKIRNMA